MSQRPDFLVPWISADYALDLADSDVNCWIHGVLAGDFYNGVFQGGVHRYQAPFVLMLKQMLDQNYQGVSKKISQFLRVTSQIIVQPMVNSFIFQRLYISRCLVKTRIRHFFFFLEGGDVNNIAVIQYLRAYSLIRHRFWYCLPSNVHSLSFHPNFCPHNDQLTVAPPMTAVLTFVPIGDAIADLPCMKYSPDKISCVSYICN